MTDRRDFLLSSAAVAAATSWQIAWSSLACGVDSWANSGLALAQSSSFR